MSLDEPALPELEARASVAAASLKERVAAFDLPAEPPRRSHRPVLLAAAVVLVIALLAAAAWVARGDDPDKVVTTDEPTGEQIFLYPSAVPSGFELTGGADLSSIDQPVPFAPADVYVDATGRKVLATLVAQFDGDLKMDEGDPVTVGGRPGRTETYRDVRVLGYQERPRRAVMFVSQSAPELDLTSLAEDATVHGDRVVLPVGGMPEGFERVGRAGIDRLLPASNLAVVMGKGDGFALGWQREDGDVLTLVVGPASPADEPVLGLLERELERRRVAGHDAVITHLGEGKVDNTAISWVQDGNLVRLTSTGIDEDELVAVMEGLSEITRAEYDGIVASSRPAAKPGSIASGGSGANNWDVYLDEGDDGRLCIDRADGGNCAGPVEAGDLNVNVDGDPGLVAGAVASGSTVDVVAGGGSLLADEPVELDGLLFFAAVVPAGVTSVEVVTTDAAGTEDRRTVATTSSHESGGEATTTTAGG